MKNIQVLSQGVISTLRSKFFKDKVPFIYSPSLAFSLISN